MKIIQMILIGLGVLVAVLVGIGLLLPSSVHVEREIVIDAPAITVHAVLNGYAHMNHWSPWAAKDPETRYSYSGPSHGVGAKMAWESDHRDVGDGNQEITLSEAPRRVETALDFGPQGTADAFFDITPTDAGSRVVWGFDTDFGMNLMGRYMGLMFDDMLGGDYEQGLANLKDYVETYIPKEDWSDLEIGLTEVEARPIAFVGGESDADSAAIGQALGESYGRVGAFLANHGLTSAGQPLTITTEWGNRYVYDAAIPIAATDLQIEGDAEDGVAIGSTYAGTVVKAVHHGPYTGLQETYEKVSAFMISHGLEEADRSWDEWVSDPGVVPEDELITHVYYPVRPMDPAAGSATDDSAG